MAKAEGGFFVVCVYFDLLCGGLDFYKRVCMKKPWFAFASKKKAHKEPRRAGLIFLPIIYARGCIALASARIRSKEAFPPPAVIVFLISSEAYNLLGVLLLQENIRSGRWEKKILTGWKNFFWLRKE